MKKLLVVLLITGSIGANAQTIEQIIKKANRTLNSGKTSNSTTQGNGGSGLLGANLSNSEIVSGLKEALQVGTKNASGKLNVTNGFFANQLIKIVLPQEVKNIEATLRSFGFNSLCDKLILSLNRAAEDAAGKAVPIFFNAITSMSLNDGLGILRGGNNAATEYLKQTTSIALTNAFRPVIEGSLGKVHATQYWNEVFKTYNKLPIVKNKVNTDLTAYVTERALNGLFITVGQEEANIRTNANAQVTTLLQKVFGKR